MIRLAPSRHPASRRSRVLADGRAVGKRRDAGRGGAAPVAADPRARARRMCFPEPDLRPFRSRPERDSGLPRARPIRQDLSCSDATQLKLETLACAADDLHDPTMTLAAIAER